MIQISWRAKLITLFTLILSVSLMVQVFYIIPFIQNREVVEAEVHHSEVARNVGREVEIGLNRLANTLELIAEHKVFRTMDIENQPNISLQYVNMSTDVQSLFVMNSTGWFVSGTVENFAAVYTTRSYTTRDYYNISFNHGEIYYSPSRSTYNNTLITTFISVPIVSDTGERVGILLGTMKMNDLIQRITEYPLEKDQVLYLVNKEGILIAHSETNIYPLGQKSALLLNYSSLYSVQEIMNGSVSGANHYYLNGTEHFGSNIIIESSGWGVVVETPMKIIRSESNLLVQNLWLFNLSFFGSALVVASIFTQQITSIQKQAEDALRRKEKLTVLGQMAGGVGHELRNPLGAIKNAIYLLNMALEEPEDEVKESLKIIDEEVTTSERIISSLLDFARPRPLNLSETIISDIVQSAQKYITVPDKIVVINNLDKNLPSIIADPEQLTQIFRNIILNGIQAMHEGGQMVINVKTENQTWLVITFTDSGEGISEENLGKLFEPLFTTKAKGIGLGLVVSKNLIEGHGGRITVQSEVGKGSTFKVRLPILTKEST